ncbi:cell 12a endoglucanase [Pseudomassariella vexata]|uniref:Cell 12a endoglucanase n=1 Tax=Pseudomassariella vexata TaxID=1141098 RepID=A0A1Y2D7K9_9PEZI|nr:cell 12a endoglucanase [Pseudomassariella vexata]ORY55263.1 cell 12a endoglucanase [Pseudomassariella vexata]
MQLTLFSAAVLAGAALASPTRTLEARSTQICGQWDSVATGTYTVYQDLWGESYADSGSQCTTVESLSGNTLAWSTSWTWSGGSTSVKSFANTVTTVSQKAISSISSMPSKWSWSYTGSSIVADVAYDLFTGSSASGSAEYEVMIWLAAIGGAGPISSTGSTIATPTIAGTTWNLYSGPNGDMTVFSFVAPSQVTSFDGDIMDFVNYLIQSQGMSSSQILQSIGAGTEPFTGSDAVFTTSAFSLSES